MNPPRRRIAVVTPLFPTRVEPYRGAPIWATLEMLRELADLTLYCTKASFPDALRLVRPRSYLRYVSEPDPARWPEPMQTVAFPAVPWLSHATNGWSLSRVLRPHLERDRFELVLSFWIYPESYGALRAASRLGVPLLAFARGSDLKILPANKRLRSKICATMCHADGILCVSNDLADTARRLGAEPTRVHVIHNGVDTNVFRLCSRDQARLRLGLDPTAHWVVYVGRLVTGKGVLHLADAILQLRATGQDWRLVLVGEGPLEPELRRRARQTGLAPYMVLPGAQLPMQVAEWLNAADLFALPSASEGCPNVILEALACGCPVVATEVGGVGELVDAESAILIPDSTPTYLAAALGRGAARNWDYAAIAKRWRRGWDEVARETLDACEVALARRSHLV